MKLGVSRTDRTTLLASGLVFLIHSSAPLLVPDTEAPWEAPRCRSSTKNLNTTSNSLLNLSDHVVEVHKPSLSQFVRIAQHRNWKSAVTCGARNVHVSAGTTPDLLLPLLGDRIWQIVSHGRSTSDLSRKTLRPWPASAPPLRQT